MADEDASEQTAQTAENSGGPMKMLISGAGIFALVLAAQIAAPPINRMIYGDPAAEAGAVEDDAADAQAAAMDGAVDLTELDPAIYTPLDPPLVVSVPDEAGDSRFLQISVQAMARSQDAIDAVRQHAPAIRNNFLFLISNWTYDDVSTLEGKEQLRAEMLEEARAIMQANTGEPGVEAIYFTAFVVQ